MCFIRSRNFLSIPGLLSVLSWKGLGSYKILFLHLLKWSCGFSFLFFFILLIWCNTFLDVKLSLHYWDKTHLVLVYNSFYMWFNLVCQYSVEDFCAYMHKRYWSVPFFMISLPAFSIRVIMTSQSEQGSVSCLSVLWRNLRRIGIHLKYIFGLIHLWSHLGLGF